MTTTSIFTLGILTGIAFVVASYMVFAIYTYYQGFKYSEIPKTTLPKNINDIDVVFKEVTKN